MDVHTCQMTNQHANMHICMHVLPKTQPNCIRSLFALANPKRERTQYRNYTHSILTHTCQMTNQHANMHICMHVLPKTPPNCICSIFALANPKRERTQYRGHTYSKWTHKCQMTNQHANMHVCMHVLPKTQPNCIRSLFALANPK